VTKAFPKEEQYGMTMQMRRSAISVASNIAEGAARQGNKEFMQFLHE
jgi:four helix bundle protein